MSCIKVNKKEYKALINLIGELEAKKLVIANEGEIPPLDHPVVQEILDRQELNNLRTTQSQVADEKLEPRIKEFFKSLGVSTQTVEALTDENNSPLPYVAKVDLAKKVLQYVEGKQDSTTLPHEAGHFLEGFLPEDHPLYKAMYNNIVNFEIYKKVKEEYVQYSKDKNPENSIRREAIAQLIGQRLKNFKGSKESVETQSRVKRWWERVLNFIKSILGGKTSQDAQVLLDEYDKAAGMIYNNQTQELTQETKEGRTIFFQTKNTGLTADELDDAIIKTQQRILAPKYTTDTDNRYVEITAEGERQVKNRVSDKRRKDIGQHESPKNKILIKLGRDLHEVLDYIFKNYDSNPTNKYSWLSKDHYKVLLDTAKAIYKESEEIQKQIDPNKTFKLWPEVRIYDKKTDTGGTIDLLVRFSDGSISRYEYKFINFHTNSDKTVLQDEVPFYKQDDYDTQVTDYETIINSNWGHQAQRLSRIIPFNLQIEYLQGKPTSKISKLESFLSGESYTTPIPSSTELTDNKELNNLISSLRALYQNARLDIKKNWLDPDARRKADQTRKAISELLVKKEAKMVLNQVNNFTKQVRDKIAIKDNTHPDYQNFNELHNLYTELKVYEDLATAIKPIVDKMDEKERNKYNLNLEKIGKEIDTTLSELKSIILDMLVKRGELRDIKGLDQAVKEIGYAEANWYYGSMIEHPYFRLFQSEINEMYDKNRKEKKEFDEKFKKTHDNLEKWAKENGMTINQALEKIINPKTGHNITPFTKEFWDRKEKAIKEQDIKWLKDNFKIKDGWKEKFEQTRKERFKYIELFYHDKEQQEAAKKTWLAENDLENENSAWYDEFAQITPKNPEKFYSEGWKYLLANKPLHEYYNAYSEGILLAATYYEKRIRYNFIPNIRQTLFETVITNGPGAVDKFNLENAFKNKEDWESGLTEYIDPITHEKIFTPPVKFINDIPLAEKSFNLTVSLSKFMESAIEYKNAKQLSGMMNMMHELLKPGNTQQYKNVRKNKYGELKKLIMGDNTVEDAFKTQMNYHLFGQHTQNISEKANELSKTKMLQEAMRVHRHMMLPLSWIGAGGSALATRSNNYFEAMKAKNFNKLQFDRASLKIATEHSLMKTLYDYWQLDSSASKSRQNQLSINATKYANSENAYFLWRKPEELNGMTQMGAMMENHTIENGKIIRIDRHSKISKKAQEIKANNTSQSKINKLLDELYKENNIKPLSELGEFKDDHFSIPEVTTEEYNKFRRKMVDSIAYTTGMLHPDDIMNIKTNLFYQLLGQYKLSWLPKMFFERFQGPRRNDSTDEVKIGRYRVLFGDLNTSREELKDRLEKNRNFRDIGVGERIVEFIQSTGAMIQPASKIFAEAISLGLFSKLGLSWNKANPEATELYFHKWIIEHPEVLATRNISMDQLKQEFMEEREAQFRAAIGELRVGLYLAMIAFLLLSDFDDDDEKLYTEIPGFKQLYKIISRTQNEVKFFYSPFDYMKMWSSPVPVFGLVETAMKAVKNSGDIMLDILFGQDRGFLGGTKHDTSPAGKYILTLTGTGHIFDLMDIEPDEALQEQIESLHE